MKLLFENWRRFLLNESISPAVDKFKICFDKEKDKFRGAMYWDYSVAPCGIEQDFISLGEGSFRRVYSVSDNPDIVLKIISNEAKTAINSNREEAAFGRNPKFIEFSPKVYDVEDEYYWIVAQKVTPLIDLLPMDREGLMGKFFPGFMNKPGGSYFLWERWKQTLANYAGYIKSGQISYTPLKGKPGEAEYEEIPGIDRFSEIQKALRDPGHPVHRLVNFVLEKDLTVWDFKPANLGYVDEEGGKKRFVILDPVVRVEDPTGMPVSPSRHATAHYEPGKKFTELPANTCEMVARKAKESCLSAGKRAGGSFLASKLQSICARHYDKAFDKCMEDRDAEESGSSDSSEFTQLPEE